MNVILTGIARSGTTLTCALLNQLPRCVALHEPMNPAFMATQEFPSGYLAEIARFFSSQRASLLSNGSAISKARDGRVPTNPFESASIGHQLRQSIVQKQAVNFNKLLPSNFILVVKHPNFFTATLSVLKHSYPCYAIVRNPLAVLLSWQTIQAPVNKGRLPYGEAFDACLKDALSSESNCLERQIIILKWYFSQYASHLPPENVIKYEEIVASSGRVLARIDPDAALLSRQLKGRNTNPLYDAGLVDQLTNRLLESDSICGDFYDLLEVESLRAALMQTRGSISVHRKTRDSSIVDAARTETASIDSLFLGSKALSVSANKPTSRMDEIGIRCNTDKASLGRSKINLGQLTANRPKGHDYLRKYDFFLSRFVNKPGYRMMELGAGPDWNIGASVHLWEEYFWRSDFRLHVVDLKPMAEKLANERVSVTIGDLGARNLLNRLAASKYDVIVDDASHLWTHQLLAFEILFPSVVLGGVYIIEDIETSFGTRREAWSQGAEIDAYTVLSHLMALVAGKGQCHPLLPITAPNEHPVLAFWSDIESITLLNGALLIAKKGYY